MFERVSASIHNHKKNVRAITVKVKVKSSKAPWKVADVQLQEGSVATEYVEHVAEMERVGG